MYNEFKISSFTKFKVRCKGSTNNSKNAISAFKKFNIDSLHNSFDIIAIPKLLLNCEKLILGLIITIYFYIYCLILNEYYYEVRLFH